MQTRILFNFRHSRTSSPTYWSLFNKMCFNFPVCSAPDSRMIAIPDTNSSITASLQSDGNKIAANTYPHSICNKWKLRLKVWSYSVCYPATSKDSPLKCGRYNLLPCTLNKNKHKHKFSGLTLNEIIWHRIPIQTHLKLLYASPTRQ